MANPLLEVGRRAPAFTLKDDRGERVRLTEWKGRWVVLFFYPKAMTPGCTTEARDFEALRSEFEAEGAVLFGLSPDPVEKLAEFREREGLGMPLLADRDARVAARYGVWREKRNYGRTYLGLVRSTFLLDPAGRIAALWDNVRVRGHVAKVLDRLREERNR